MSWMENHNIVEELKSVFEDMKMFKERKENEVHKIGEALGETKDSLSKVHDRLDDLETKWSRPTVHGESNKTEVSDYAKAFDKWFATGDDKAIREIKAVSMNETFDPDGGYLVPPEYANFIVESLVEWSPIRRYARVLKVNSKEFRIPVQKRAQNPDTGAAESGLFRTGWTSDLGAVPQTDTGQVGLQTIPTNDLYALPYATQDMLEDFGFGNLESYIQQNLAKSIALAEGTAFVNGTGVGQPLGLLTNDSFEEIKTGNATSLGASPDVLIDAFYKLPDYYAREGTWLMNRTTIRIIREFVDGNGQYLWTPNYGVTIPNAAPALILDRPYAECIDMPAADANDAYANGAIPILFGNVYEAYTITDRMDIRVLRDPYSQKPFVLFYTTKRVGGQTILPEAMVKIKCAV